MLERFTLLFPLWTLLAAALALIDPWLFTWLQGPLIVLALAVVMLGMGLELELVDFQRVLRRPGPPALGVAAQFLVMPALAALVAALLRMPPPLAVGLILVGCCPGGTASNVVTLIARAGVALSVVMTTASTLAAMLLTPLLTVLLAGPYVPVDGWKLLLDVLLPLALGVGLTRWVPSLFLRLAPVMPPLAVLAIRLFVATIVGRQRRVLMAEAPLLLLASLLLHGGGFLLGWLIPAVLG